jgi:hypothetical protein
LERAGYEVTKTYYFIHADRFAGIF